MLAAIRNVERELKWNRLPVAVRADAVAVARHLTGTVSTRKSHGVDRGQDLDSITRLSSHT